MKLQPTYTFYEHVVVDKVDFGRLLEWQSSEGYFLLFGQQYSMRADGKRIIKPQEQITIFDAKVRITEEKE